MSNIRWLPLFRSEVVGFLYCCNQVAAVCSVHWSPRESTARPFMKTTVASFCLALYKQFAACRAEI